MMMAKRYEDMTTTELLAQLETYPSPGGSPQERIRATLQVRLADQQDVTARALVKSTSDLVATTSRLAWATWGLVGATALLVVVEVILKIWGPK